MSQDDYTIRTMSADEIQITVDWAATEGWNPGLHDAENFYVEDKTGFLLGELNGEVISTISAVRYGDGFGFMGFYIVKPEYRGKGYGIRIWDEAIDYLSGRNIGLDGVVEQQKNYEKYGFQIAYRNVRYEGVSGGASNDSANIMPLNDFSFDEVNAYDQHIFPENRQTFLKTWINQKDTHAFGITNASKLVGYGVIRRCGVGYKIGALCADTAEQAEALFLKLKSSVEPDQPIFLDIPETNPEALKLVKKYNMSPVFETARMYTKAAPDIDINRLFGVTSFELG